MTEPTAQPDFELPGAAGVPLGAISPVSAPPPRPLFAQSLWLSGALLWAYVVTGELVVNLLLPELLGFAGLVATLGFSWYVVIEGERTESVAWPRRVAAALIAFGVFLLCLVLALTVSGPSSAGAVTIALWFVAAFLLFLGRHHTRREQSNELPGPRQVLAWVAVSLVTLLALVSAASGL